MAYQAVFKRYEMKFLLTAEQKRRLLAAMEPYMAPDEYGCTTIRNLYFDTDDYRLIRRSIEHPVYKEKLRLRSYHRAEPDSAVYVELKKKYDSVVYKRRLSMEEQKAMSWLCGGEESPPDSQIAREIHYCLGFYQTLKPRVFLSYQRQAYFCRDGSDVRVTFDEDILCRREELSLGAQVWGTPLLEEGKVLMEVKTSGGIPLWLAGFLSREGIYKTTFSKYGAAYQTIIFPKIQGGCQYA